MSRQFTQFTDQLERISRLALKRPFLLKLLVLTTILVVGIVVSHNYFPRRLGQIDDGGGTVGATVILKITDHDDKKIILPNDINNLTVPDYHQAAEVTDLAPYKDAVTSNLLKLPRLQGEIDYR